MMRAVRSIALLAGCGLLMGCSARTGSAPPKPPAVDCPDRTWSPKPLPPIRTTDTLKQHDRQASIALDAADRRADACAAAVETLLKDWPK
jgi:hypothetical protein